MIQIVGVTSAFNCTGNKLHPRYSQPSNVSEFEGDMVNRDSIGVVPCSKSNVPSIVSGESEADRSTVHPWQEQQCYGVSIREQCLI